MRYKRLGKTDLIVSELGFGAWGIGGNEFGNSYGSTDDRTSIAAIRTALDLGCCFIDTADVYGHGRSEILVGRALREAGRNDVILATKVGANFREPPTRLDFSRAHVTRAIEDSLRRLGRERIDLYQLHNPPLQVIRSGEVFDVMEELKESGKVRHFGVSIFSVEEGLACADSGRPETLQLVYNLFALIDAQYSLDPLFSRAGELDLGLIAREPLANGFLSGRHREGTAYEPGDVRARMSAGDRKISISLAHAFRNLAGSGATLAQIALRFVLDQPAITTAIVGIKTPEQARENFASARLPPFETLVQDFGL
ncbi:aldo/keto reductase [Methylorubrum extorquens]